LTPHSTVINAFVYGVALWRLSNKTPLFEMEAVAMGLVRLFLAFVVAYDHLLMQHFSGSDPVPRIFLLGMIGPYAVLFFYIISGFLISYAIANKYGTSSEGMKHFYLSRFVRIFSLYWPLLLLATFDPSSRAWISTAPLIDRFFSVTLIGMDWRYAFATYPAPHIVTMPLLGQAWTLGAELTFYAIAPFLMRSWKVACLVALSAMIVRGLLVYCIGLHPVWSFFFFPSTFVFFLLGHLIRVISSRLAFLKNALVGIFFVMSAVCIMTFGQPFWDNFAFWIAVLSFTISLPGLFECTKDKKLVNILGELSFPIYLTHEFVFVGGYRFIRTGLQNWGKVDTFVLSMAACLVVAQASQTLLERPFATILRGVFLLDFSR
jgi:peptidoglycan/LPS O-acetylase OafA/YrhL